MNSEWLRVWREMIVTCLKALFQHLTGEIEDDNENTSQDLPDGFVSYMGLPKSDCFLSYKHF
jgi:hypothetical protein